MREALAEFHSMVEESIGPDEKSLLLIHEAKCYSMKGLVNDAERIIGQIQELVPKDLNVRLLVDYGIACVAAQAGRHDEAFARFQRILEQYSEILEAHDYCPTCEDVHFRRALALACLGRYGDAFPFLRDAASFCTLSAADQQHVHLLLGYCYAERNEGPLAKEQFLRAIGFGMVNDFEVEARYRVAALYMADHGFAQAKYQLESIIQTCPQGLPHVPRRDVYEQLSQACRYLGEKDNAQRYKEIAESV